MTQARQVQLNLLKMYKRNFKQIFNNTAVSYKTLLYEYFKSAQVNVSEFFLLLLLFFCHYIIIWIIFSCLEHDFCLLFQITLAL